jgi:hypothetical protein
MYIKNKGMTIELNEDELFFFEDVLLYAKRV